MHRGSKQQIKQQFASALLFVISVRSEETVRELLGNNDFIAPIISYEDLDARLLLFADFCVRESDKC